MLCVCKPDQIPAEEGDGHETLPQVKEVLTLDSSWGKERGFSLGVIPLVSCCKIVCMGKGQGLREVG